jgi:phosphatidylglycerol:prolipoprotein diacylglycerol transferase
MKIQQNEFGNNPSSAINHYFSCMHPELFSFKTPSFLVGLFPEEITIYAYGAMILLGVIAAYSYLKKYGKEDFGMSEDSAQNLVIGLIVMSVVGGKFFMIFEDPKFYAKNLSALFSNSGFVFYGSLIFSLGFVFWFIQKNQLPTWKFLDLIAYVALIVHAFGRVGCFFAGCCHGIESHGLFAVTFTDPASQANPLNTPLHPTQLYSAFMLVTIFTFLTFWKKRKKFDGQIFLLYIMLYSFGRSIIEEFRGDEARGFIFDGWYSNSQFISTLLIISAIIAYVYRRKMVVK